MRWKQDAPETTDWAVMRRAAGRGGVGWGGEGRGWEGTVEVGNQMNARCRSCIRSPSERRTNAEVRSNPSPS